MLTQAQRDALVVAAKAFGWDAMSLHEVKLLAWCAFHYLVVRLEQGDAYQGDAGKGA